MLWSRIPLFLLGLIYGAIINSCATGICYGLIMIKQWIPAISKIIHRILKAGLVIAFIAGGLIGLTSGIWQGLVLSDSLTIMFTKAVTFIVVGALLGIQATIAILAAACLVTAALGFATGMLYALTKGTWHCAMDFYNNGLTQGLTSPFRFLSAFWNDVVNHNRVPLLAYYESTDIGILEKRAIAEKLFERKIGETQLMVKQLSRQSSASAASELPDELTNMITIYAVDPTKISFPDTKGHVARAIEASDQRDARRIPISRYLTPQTINSVINRRCSFHRPPTRRINSDSNEKQGQVAPYSFKTNQ